MGDASLSAASMMQHFYYEPMAKDFVDTMIDEMGDDGSLVDVAPFQRFGGRPGDLSWNAAFLSVLHALMQEGDNLHAKHHWDSVKKNIAFLEGVVKQAGSIDKLPEPYGDWCPPPTEVGKGQGAKPSKGFAAAFSLINTIQQAADIGHAIGGQWAEDGKAFAAT